MPSVYILPICIKTWMKIKTLVMKCKHFNYLKEVCGLNYDYISLFNILQKMLLCESYHQNSQAIFVCYRHKRVNRSCLIKGSPQKVLSRSLILLRMSLAYIDVTWVCKIVAAQLANTSTITEKRSLVLVKCLPKSFTKLVEKTP